MTGIWERCGAVRSNMGLQCSLRMVIAPSNKDALTSCKMLVESQRVFLSCNRILPMSTYLDNFIKKLISGRALYQHSLGPASLDLVFRPVSRHTPSSSPPLCTSSIFLSQMTKFFAVKFLYSFVSFEIKTSFLL